MKNISVIIPSLDPDKRLSKVVEGLRQEGFCDFIIVDDGSREENKKFFPKGDDITLLSHGQNFGKGTALKTAIKYVVKNRPDTVGVVTCDGDGQHLASDTKKVAEKMKESGDFVLGVRDFSGDDVPKKSRIGNKISSVSLLVFCGLKISDTQTGLRGIPADLLADMLEVEGARFEYETNVLISLRSFGAKCSELKIETVYLDENKGTHFNPLKDTMRIFSVVTKYVLSSTVSFITDIVLFAILSSICSLGVLVSTVIARAVSSVINFLLNKKIVFRSSVSVWSALAKYYLLAVIVMLVSGFSVKGLAIAFGFEQGSFAVTAAKVVVDCILFIINYFIQKKWVFPRKPSLSSNMKKQQIKKAAQTDSKSDTFVSKSERKANNAGKKKLTFGKVIWRIFLSLITIVICLVVALYTILYILVNAGCEPLRDKLVLSATQASATKWLPSLFMSQESVDKIVAKSFEVNEYVVSMDSSANDAASNTQTNVDIWENAVDGMLFEKISGNGYTGYVLLVKDASRVFVGTSSDNNYKNATRGINIFDMAKKENAVAIINAGEFNDVGGQGSGATPMGITYSKGSCVWNDSLKRTFIGFDKDNKLVVTEPMTKAQAEEMGIRDGVSFQNKNTLITNDGVEMTYYRTPGNVGSAQRTAIGQTADGTVILVVTDGRSAGSIGATRDDIIDVMASYNAVTAGMLDGGSSSMMYYENYFDKYGYNKDKLDEYQKQGIVNKYKAFTPPRRMPTYICVSALAESAEE